MQYYYLWTKGRVDMSESGISFSTVLFIVFLVLKLCGVISWSWWWVTAPLWGGAALGLLVAVPVLLFIRWVMKSDAW